MNNSAIIVEGITDRAIFFSLLLKVGLAHKVEKPSRTYYEPPELDSFKILVAPEEVVSPGDAKTNAIDLFVDVIKKTEKQTWRKVFLAIDMNGDTKEEIFLRVRSKSRDEIVLNEEGTFSKSEMFACVIPLGLPDRESLVKDWKLQRFSNDDYIFGLILREEVFAELKRREHKIKQDYDKIISKLREILELLENQEMPLHDSKAILQLFRGVAGFVLSPAAFAQRVIECSNAADIEDFFGSVLRIIRADIAI